MADGSLRRTGQLAADTPRLFRLRSTVGPADIPLDLSSAVCMPLIWRISKFYRPASHGSVGTEHRRCSTWKKSTAAFQPLDTVQSLLSHRRKNTKPCHHKNVHLKAQVNEARGPEWERPSFIGSWPSVCSFDDGHHALNLSFIHYGVPKIPSYFFSLHNLSVTSPSTGIAFTWLCLFCICSWL